MASHAIDVTFRGDVFSVYLELEGEEIDLSFDVNDNSWKRKVQMPVVGGLNVFMNARGINGTAWTLSLKVDGKGPHDEEGVVKKGRGRLDTELPLPLIDRKGGS
jgi:hypothetical protein